MAHDLFPPHPEWHRGAILGLFLIPQRREYRGIPVDYPGLLALATFLVPLILGISWARRDDTEPSTLLLLGLATVAGKGVLGTVRNIGAALGVTITSVIFEHRRSALQLLLYSAYKRSSPEHLDTVRELEHVLQGAWIHETDVPAMALRALRQQIDLEAVAAGFRDSFFVGGIALLVHVGIPPQQVVVVGGEDDDGVVAELPYLTYLANNSHLIPNYGERYRNGAALATGFVESTVNQVVSQRCCKTQQLPWSTGGAPRLRPTCVKPRNGVCAPSSPIAPCLPSRGGFRSDVLSQIAGPRALQTLSLLLPQGPLAVI